MKRNVQQMSISWKEMASQRTCVLRLLAQLQLSSSLGSPCPTNQYFLSTFREIRIPVNCFLPSPGHLYVRCVTADLPMAVARAVASFNKEYRKKLHYKRILSLCSLIPWIIQVKRFSSVTLKDWVFYFGCQPFVAKPSGATAEKDTKQLNLITLTQQSPSLMSLNSRRQF